MTLEELQRLCDEASPADLWEEETTRSDAGGEFEYANGPWHDQRDGDNDKAQRDARFIAAARTYLPKLIAVARAAKLFQQWYNAEEEEDDAFDDEKISEAAEKIDDSLDALGEQSP